MSDESARIASLETLVTERFDRIDEKLDAMPDLAKRVGALEVSAANARAWLAGAIAVLGALLWVVKAIQ